MTQAAKVIEHEPEAERKPAGAVAIHEQAAAPTSESAAIIAMIERAARDPSVDIEKMKQLMAMRKEAMADEAQRAYDEAMSKAQAQMGPVAADSNNPQTKSRYASYYALDKAVRPIYTANGFALSYGTTEGAPEGMVRVTCRVSHSAGHGVNKHIDMPADGKGAKGGEVMTRTHATVAAVSYGMRSLLKMIFNIAIGEGDDDGNSVGQGETLSGEQVKEISDLLTETKSNSVLFLKAIKLESLTQIRADKFEAAKTLIRTTAAKRAEREAAQKEPAQ